MPIRISSGMTVQRISTVRFSWKVAGTAPLERRCMIIDQNITANTMAPMITEIQKMVMCRLKTERLTSVAPGLMLTVQLALAFPAGAMRNKPPSQVCACRNIPVSPYLFFLSDWRPPGSSVKREYRPEGDHGNCDQTIFSLAVKARREGICKKLTLCFSRLSLSCDKRN